MRKKIVYPLTASSGGLTSITASNVDSESATSGQVLTANGNGGATWETPASGGGSDLYIHTIYFSNNATGSGDNGFAGIFDIINTVSTVMAQTEIRQWVSSLPNNARIMATGMYVDAKPATREYNIAYFKKDGNNFYIGSVSTETGGNSYPRFTSSPIGTINDVTFIDNDNIAPYKIQ